LHVAEASLAGWLAQRDQQSNRGILRRNYNQTNLNLPPSSISVKPFQVTAVSNMSYVAKGEKEYDAAGPVPTAKLHKIRITLTSSNVKNLEKCSSSLAFG
jgi:hypothetical protein